MIQLPETLHDLGYRLIEDCWDIQGRRTYIHDDDVTRDHLTLLNRMLGPSAWRRHPDRLRAYLHENGELIEIEPGGDASGHYLHHMMPQVAG
jgi:hypothetical protein